MPWTIFREAIISQLRANPALVYVITVVSTGVGLVFMSYIYAVFAEKTAVNEQFLKVAAVSEDIQDEVKALSVEVSKLSSQTKELDKNAQIRAIEAVIRALDTEIFELEGLLKSEHATEKQRIRYAQLRSDKAEQERRLAWLTR